MARIIIVTPVNRIMTAGDTLRLHAEARDPRHVVIPGVTFRRHKNDVFIADEVFPTTYPKGTKDAAAGREIGHLNTADMDGHVKNAAIMWVVVVNPKDGLAYVNDDNNGLWIVRIEPKTKVVP